MFVKHPLLLMRQCGSGKPFLVTPTIFSSRSRDPRSLPLLMLWLLSPAAEHRERYALCRTLLGVFDVTAVDIAGNRECSLILAHRGQFGLDRLCAHAATVSAVKDLEQYLKS
jgi:hypothetical protein